MSCDHELIAAHVCDYIDNTISIELRARCELVLQNCAQCREIVAHALAFQNMAQNWQEQPVPDWQRARFASPVPKSSANWLNWSAIATSCLALLLVVLQVQISTVNGLSISFGRGQQEARLQQLVAEQLATYKAEQDQFLEDEFTEFAGQQETKTLLNLAQAMDRNRAERRQELSFIMTDFETRRLTQQQAIAEQLNELASNQNEDNQSLNALVRLVTTSRVNNL
jgi:hypothetical protein